MIQEEVTHEKLIEKIEEMLGGLEKCEKALADYLETKRVAYPRFYFVASADLLDILSKGSNPHAILNHLPKCFDNVKTLEFNLDKDGNKTKKSVGKTMMFMMCCVVVCIVYHIMLLVNVGFIC
jgi:hypothetical protein